MWDASLIGLSILSAVMSAGLGVAFVYTLRLVGQVSVEPHHDVGPDESPQGKVSVVIPARNEALDIEASVRSVLAMEHVDLEVIVVNDHSEDETGTILDAIAAEDSRLTVVHNPPLREGWLGKPNAMDAGVAHARGETILFSDADVLHHRSELATALDVMHREQLDMLSLCPRFHCDSLFENVVLPHLFIAGTVQFCLQAINSPTSPHGAAAGAFILLSRQKLDELGGIHAIRNEFLDDVAIAREVKRSGGKARLHFAPELSDVRLFKGNHHAIWGLTKNILGAVDHIVMAIPAMFLPLVVYWIPLICFGIGLAKGSLPMTIAGATAYAIQCLLLIPVARYVRFNPFAAVLFPLGIIPVMCSFSAALYHRVVSGSVAWRGRVIPVTS